MFSDHSRLKVLFFAACDLPPDEQTALIDERCGDDTDLRRALRKLLNKDKSADGILSDDNVVRGIEVHLDAVEPDTTDAPHRISRYTIKRRLGAGGMGVVWLAEQDNPKRDVAVKVIRGGMMSRVLRRRFELEAAVLGRLQHPGIAQVYEAGMFDDGGGGKPFFAMEYVDGVPLSEYVAQHEPTLRRRLELFMQICDAVHHAHQRGIIHRDLKPANILVVERDEETKRWRDGVEGVDAQRTSSLRPSVSQHARRGGSLPQPKILDFGVARATDSDMQVSTLQTDVGQLVGTVPYMSPEQIAGRAHDVDTRSDVYALGVILYELLVDRLPYDLGDKSIVHAARVITEIDPSPLFTVSRTYRGDLNTIVLKALEKDPERRYQSAQQLAGDVRHYLNDEPIVARPATTAYQLRKFARRNKALVGGVAAAIVILIAGVISTTIGMVQARSEANRAGAINDFMTDILTSIDPAKANPDVKLVDVLRDASDTVATRFANHPRSRNEVHALLGNAFAKLTAYPESAPHLQSVFEYHRDTFGTNDPRTLRAAATYIQSLHHLGRIDTTQDIGEDILSALSPEELGSRDGIVLRRQIINAVSVRPKDLDAAIQKTNAILVSAREKFGEDDVICANIANDLGIMYVSRVVRGVSEDHIADLERGVEHLRFAVRNPEVYAGSLLDEARARLNLADALARLGELEEAEAQAQHILAISSAFGENHVVRGYAFRTLADIHHQLGNAAEAAEYVIEYAEIDRRRDGDSAIFALTAMSDALPMIEAAGFHEKGEEYARILLREMGAAHGHIADLHRIYLARFRSAQGADEEARQLFHVVRQSPHFETNANLACLYHLFMGEHEHAQGDPGAAPAHFAEVEQLRHRLDGVSPPKPERIDVGLARAGLSTEGAVHGE